MDDQPKPSCLREVIVGNSDDVTGYYSALGSLPASDGMLWDASLGGWLVLSHRVCRSLGESQCLGPLAVDITAGTQPDVREFVQSIFRSQLMAQDPRVLQRRRHYWSNLLNEHISDRELKNIAETAIESCPRDVEKPDLYGSLLDAYVSQVACTSLRIPHEYRGQIAPLVMSYVGLIDGKISRTADIDGALLDVARLYNHLSVLTPPGFEPDGYSRHEWLSDLEFVLVAGHVSVAYLLGTIFLQVPQPSDPGRLYPSRLVTESLRYDSPVQLTGHLVRSEMSVAGQTLRPGDRIFFHLGMANRDPEQFPAPDLFDALRPARKALPFGAVPGSLCPGRRLATRSAAAFLEVLVDRGEWLCVDPSGVRRDTGIAGRGFRLLPGRLVHWPAADGT